MNNSNPSGELVERLLRKAKIRPSHGGGTVDATGKGTFYTTDDGMGLVNPDGPEAASALINMEKRIGEMRSALERIRDHDGISYRYGDEIRAIAVAALKEGGEPTAVG